LYTGLQYVLCVMCNSTLATRVQIACHSVQMLSILQKILGNPRSAVWTREFELSLLYHILSVHMNTLPEHNHVSTNELLIRLVVTHQYHILMYLFFMTLPENEALQFDIRRIFHHNKQDNKWDKFNDGIKYIRTDHIEQNATGDLLRSTSCIDVVVACDTWWKQIVES
jgi:hypothetical protein